MSARPADLMEAIGSKFRSRLHEPRTAAILGATLGVTFSLCFLTGLFSHLLQHPVSWLTVPTRPAGLYRVTQAVHVLTGITSIPILLAKLWVVSPKLWSWPPAKSVVEGLERLMLLPLVGGGVFLLLSGVANVARWYPYPFYFTVAHYQVAWVTVGAMLVHLGVKWRTAGDELRRHERAAADPRLLAARRRFLGSVAGASGVLFLSSAGNTISPLSRLAVLAQRRPGVGPQGLPVNKSAASARVLTTARDPGYRLVVSHGGSGRRGRRRDERSFSLDDLRRMPQRSASLPIACVEGWSTSADWRGVAVRDVLAAAGVGVDEVTAVRVVSLQRGGGYGTSMLEPNEIADDDTLLALELNGEVLHIDHGFPVRLIAPNRSGVLQTKWVGRLEVS